jgi:hypothetical protein
LNCELTTKELRQKTETPANKLCKTVDMERRKKAQVAVKYGAGDVQETSLGLLLIACSKASKNLMQPPQKWYGKTRFDYYWLSKE